MAAYIHTDRHPSSYGCLNCGNDPDVTCCDGCCPLPLAQRGELPLDRMLAEFTAAMRAKFFARKAKHEGNSVTDFDFDWVKGLDRAEIEGHFRAEVKEWLDAEGPAARLGEDVDVANMAFLTWAVDRMERIDYRCPVKDCYFGVSGPYKDIAGEIGHHNLIIHTTVIKSSGGKA
jgi:hypothetical protein